MLPLKWEKYCTENDDNWVVLQLVEQIEVHLSSLLIMLKNSIALYSNSLIN
jgi:hypothetical protein